MNTPISSNPDLAHDQQFVAPELITSTPEGPRLLAGKCSSCGALSFPKAAVCCDCLSQDIEPSPLGTTGVLYSFSIVHQAPKGWTVPYALGYVDLPEGVRVLAHINAAPDAIAIDQTVRLGMAEVGTNETGEPLFSYVFAPDTGASK